MQTVAELTDAEIEERSNAAWTAWSRISYSAERTKQRAWERYERLQAEKDRREAQRERQKWQQESLAVVLLPGDTAETVQAAIWRARSIVEAYDTDTPEYSAAALLLEENKKKLYKLQHGNTENR